MIVKKSISTKNFEPIVYNHAAYRHEMLPFDMSMESRPCKISLEGVPPPHPKLAYLISRAKARLHYGKSLFIKYKKSCPLLKFKMRGETVSSHGPA